MNIFKFGKHKGLTFKEVRKDEPSYFIWLWNEVGNKLNNDLYKFIESNLKELQKEAINEHIDFMRDACDGEVCIEY